jgi:1-acyl-sn-glycerol-3-phosphate acyltransferase
MYDGGNPASGESLARQGRVTTSASAKAVTLARQWLRRIFVISLYTALAATLLLLFVPLLALAAACDALRRQHWTLVRTLVFFLWYLLLELAGVAVAFTIWLVHGPWTGRDHERYLDRNYALQAWWARMLGGGGFAIFGMRTELDRNDSVHDERPALVFVRHASTADTILAAQLLAAPHGLRLRYVLKRELLWDPCLDVVGNRLPNVFVDRDSAHSEQGVASIEALARGMRAGEGVLIYPEGTRFSLAKKRRIVDKMRKQGQVAKAEEAEALRHVLPPRSGGSLALLAAAPEASAVFLAHTGFEDAASFDRFFRGGLVGRTVHVQIRTVPASRIPEGRVAQKEWLMQQWREVDEFIESHRRRRPENSAN